MNKKVKSKLILHHYKCLDYKFSITTLYNGMILFTLSINSYDFALGFPEMPHIKRDSIPHL